MNSITILCSASPQFPQKYGLEICALTNFLMEKGITIHCAAENMGLLKEIYTIAIPARKVVGYETQEFATNPGHNPQLGDYKSFENLEERRTSLITSSPVNLFFPGGSGTLEEFFSALTLKRMNLLTSELILYNFQDYYTPLIQQLNQMEHEKFIERKMFKAVTNQLELAKLLHSEEIS